MITGAVLIVRLKSVGSNLMGGRHPVRLLACLYLICRNRSSGGRKAADIAGLGDGPAIIVAEIEEDHIACATDCGKPSRGSGRARKTRSRKPAEGEKISTLERFCCRFAADSAIVNHRNNFYCV